MRKILKEKKTITKDSINDTNAKGKNDTFDH